MVAIPVVIIGSFLLAFKAVLLEGSEVTILSLAIVKTVGKRNVILGVGLGAIGSVLTLLVVSTIFQFLSDVLINLVAGVIILYFSYRFLRGFVKYYFKGKSFRDKMDKIGKDIVSKDLQHSRGEEDATQIPFSLANSLPVFSITMTEGFEASLVLAAAGSFNMEWTAIGGLLSIALLIVIAIVSYDYLMRFPRWLLDLIGGCILFSFGSYFFISGVLLYLGL